WRGGDASEGRLVQATCGVQLVRFAKRVVAVEAPKLRQRRDADALRRDELLHRGCRQRRRGEGDDLLVRADDLDEAAVHDELTAGGPVVGPQARHERGALLELRVKLTPDRRADPLPSPPRLDREPDEIAAGREAGRLVMDLAVADRGGLLVDRDDADSLVARGIPAGLRCAPGVRGHARA